MCALSRHSVDLKYFKANMSNLLSIWDRLFGAYVDPDTVPIDFSFGIGGKENPIRLTLGV